MLFIPTDEPTSYMVDVESNFMIEMTTLRTGKANSSLAGDRPEPTAAPPLNPASRPLGTGPPHGAEAERDKHVPWRQISLFFAPFELMCVFLFLFVTPD